VAAAPAAGGIDAAGVRRVWPEVLEAIKLRRRTHALLLNAVVSTVEGEVLALAVSTAPLARLLSEDSNLEHIRTALRDILGVDWKVRVEIADGSDGTPPPAAPGAVRDDDPRDEMSPDDPPPTQEPPRDPERDAISLLRSTLGAQQIDDAP
jgi:DNA polymerase-3 subunit gamma/tau